MVQRARFGREGAEFGRGLGFFDAIYGFAITLLVANVDLPPVEAWQSLSALLASGIGTQLLGFAISFVVIALFWHGNTKLLARFDGLDWSVIAVNLVTTAFIVLIPFTTQGISDPEISEAPLPTALYAANVALALMSQSAMIELGRARGLLREDVSSSVWWARRLDAAVRCGVFLLSIPVAYLAGPDWAQMSWLLLIPLGVVTGRFSDRVAARAEAGSRENS